MVETPSSGRAGTAAALVIVTVAWALLHLCGLGRAPFHTRGEPREAVVIQDLVQHGRWLLPRRNAVEVPRKPPLYYWLGGIAAHALGRVDELTARLPSAGLSGAAALLVTLVTALCVAPRAGALAGLTLLTSFEWLRAATTARVDMTLAFGLTVVFCSLLAIRRDARTPWLFGLYFGIAWATLAKGIPGLAIPTLQILLLCLVDRSTAPLRALRPLRGLPIVLLVVAAWYSAALLQGGRAFFDIVVNENLLRISERGAAALGHAHGLAYLVGSLLAGLLPWTIALPAVVLALWRDRAGLERRGARVFALLWIVAVFAPYALASSKRGVYLLPLYPAAALLIGWWADRLLTDMGAARAGRRALAGLLWALAWVVALLALITLAQSSGFPLVDTARDALPHFAAPYSSALALTLAGASGRWLPAIMGAIAILAAAGALAATRSRPQLAYAAIIVCLALVIISARLVIAPAVAELATRRPFVGELRNVVRDPALVHTSPQLDYGTLFYWGSALPVYDPGSGGDGPPYLIMPEVTWRHAGPALRERYEPLRRACLSSAAAAGCPIALSRRGAAAADPSRSR